MVSFSLPVNTVVLCLSWSLTHVFPVAGNKFPNVWTCRRTEFTSSSLQWLCRSACDNTPFLSPSTTGLIPTQCCLGWQKERSSLVSSVLENLPALVSQHGRPGWAFARQSVQGVQHGTCQQSRAYAWGRLCGYRHSVSAWPCLLVKLCVLLWSLCGTRLPSSAENAWEPSVRISVYLGI